MGKTEKEIETEETVFNNESTDAVDSNQEVTNITYEILMNNALKFSQNVGQIVWVDDKSKTEGGSLASNKINIVRVLSDGTKQLFSLTVTEEVELKMTK